MGLNAGVVFTKGDFARLLRDLPASAMLASKKQINYHLTTAASSASTAISQICLCVRVAEPLCL